MSCVSYGRRSPVLQRPRAFAGCLSRHDLNSVDGSTLVAAGSGAGNRGKLESRDIGNLQNDIVAVGIGGSRLGERAGEGRGIGRGRTGCGNPRPAYLIDPRIAGVVGGALRVNVNVVAVRVGRQTSDGYRGGVLLAVVEITLHHAGVAGGVGDGLVPDVVGGPGDGRSGRIPVLIDENLWGGVAGPGGI